MKEHESRRHFLKKVTGAGMATLVFPAISKSNPTRLPMMLCSRDEEDGLKVNQPGWEILRDNGNVLDAVEKSTNVAELAHGFQKENLLTEKSRLEWLGWKENLSDDDDWLAPADGMYREKGRSSGTINVFAVNQNGDIAGITSTSGLAFKIPGRVGDSPIIGAGLYVDNDVGAAGATGRGEEVIRTCGSFYTVHLHNAARLMIKTTAMIP